MHRDQEPFKKSVINWDDMKKFRQAVDEMYMSRLFGEEKMIDWEEETDAENMWTSCKAYFKEIYAKQKRYNKATGKFGFESTENLREKNIAS